MCASFFTLLTAVVEVDGTRMSSNSIYDQFVCRIWLTRFPLWNFVSTSSYGILLTTSERYAAVIYHAWYHNNVRTASVLLALHFMLQKSSLFTLLKYRKCRLHYRTDAMPPVILTTGCSTTRWHSSSTETSANTILQLLSKYLFLRLSCLFSIFPIKHKFTNLFFTVWGIHVVWFVLIRN